MMITSCAAQPQASLGHAEHVEVFPQRRKERAFHPLELNAKEHYDVGTRYRFVHVAGGADTKPRDVRGYQRRGAADPDVAPHLRQQMNVRPAARGCAAGRR